MKNTSTLFKISFAKHCAWRATYIDVLERQVFRVVLDPERLSRGPNLSFQFGLGNFHNDVPKWLKKIVWALHSREFRIPMPHVRWHYKGSKLRNWLASKSSAFWSSLDGRNRKEI